VNPFVVCRTRARLLRRRHSWDRLGRQGRFSGVRPTCLAIPSGCQGAVLGNAAAENIHIAEVDLCGSEALFCGFAVPKGGLRVILGNTLSHEIGIAEIDLRELTQSIYFCFYLS
jgi:hypothetical protein